MLATKGGKEKNASGHQVTVGIGKKSDDDIIYIQPKKFIEKTKVWRSLTFEHDFDLHIFTHKVTAWEQFWMIGF